MNLNQASLGSPGGINLGGYIPAPAQRTSLLQQALASFLGSAASTVASRGIDQVLPSQEYQLAAQKQSQDEAYRQQALTQSGGIAERSAGDEERRIALEEGLNPYRMGSLSAGTANTQAQTNQLEQMLPLQKMALAEDMKDKVSQRALTDLNFGLAVPNAESEMAQRAAQTQYLGAEMNKTNEEARVNKGLNDRNDKQSLEQWYSNFAKVNKFTPEELQRIRLNHPEFGPNSPTVPMGEAPGVPLGPTDNRSGFERMVGLGKDLTGAGLGAVESVIPTAVNFFSPDAANSMVNAMPGLPSSYQGAEQVTDPIAIARRKAIYQQLLQQQGLAP